MTDWEEAKARLETLADHLVDPVHVADIRAALRELDEWRETARSEMAGRRAAEAERNRAEDRVEILLAEVERLRAILERLLTTFIGIGSDGEQLTQEAYGPALADALDFARAAMRGGGE